MILILTEDDIIEYINDYTVLINRDLSTYNYDVLRIMHEDEVHLARLCDSNGELSTVEIETV